MSEPESSFKRWTAKRKTQVVLEILKGKTTVAEVARQSDLTPAEVESWIDEGVSGMENDFKVRPKDIRDEYEQKLSQAYLALGEKDLELKTLKKAQRLLDQDENS